MAASSAWKRQNARTQMLSTVTCYPPYRWTGAHTDWFKTHVPDQTRERPHFIQSLADLCRPTLEGSYTSRLSLIFIAMGGPPRPILTREKASLLGKDCCRICIVADCKARTCC